MFEQTLLFDLYTAYLAARRGKRQSSDVHTFELRATENLLALKDAILSRTYSPGRSSAFIIKDPVTREIFAAPFRDRIVHHYLYQKSAAWWDARFLPDSYSCRDRKGTLYALHRLQHHLLSATNNGQQDAFVVKLDLQSYFTSLPRARLYSRILWGLHRQFPDSEGARLLRLLKYLWHQIIFDDPTLAPTFRCSKAAWRTLPSSKSLFSQPPGRGIVIGNLTSQLLSNIYLDQLDRFITFTLGYHHYGRYVDDFFIVVPLVQKPQLLRDLPLITSYLTSLGLTLHPKKQYKQLASHGVPFLGALVFPRTILPGPRLKQNARQAFRAFAEGHGSLASVTSYLGLLKHLNSKKFLKATFEELGWDYTD